VEYDPAFAALLAFSQGKSWEVDGRSWVEVEEVGQVDYEEAARQAAFWERLQEEAQRSAGLL